MGYSRKNQTVEVEDILFWKKKNPGVFHFFTLYFSFFILSNGVKFIQHNFEGKFYTAVFSSAIGFTCKVYI